MSFVLSLTPRRHVFSPMRLPRDLLKGNKLAVLRTSGRSFSCYTLSCSERAQPANPRASVSFRSVATTLHKTTLTTPQVCHNSIQTRSFGSRGARGHGWYVKMKENRGGRHLQGEYYDRESLEERQEWNKRILELGSTKIYMDIDVQTKGASVDASKDSNEESKHRLVIELASAVMPRTCNHIFNLCKPATRQSENDDHPVTTWHNQHLYRLETNVGICGGATRLTSNATVQAQNRVEVSGKTLEVFAGRTPDKNDIDDPLAMWHLPGTVSMIVSNVDHVDARFLLCTKDTPHLDGLHRAVGMLDEESLKIVDEWHSSLLTGIGGTTTLVSLVIKDCGILDTTADTDGTNDNTSEAAA